MTLYKSLRINIKPTAEMEQLNLWKDTILNSLRNLTDGFFESLSSFFGALLTLFIGWLLAKFIRFIFVKVLRSIHFDQLVEKLNIESLFIRLNIKIKPSAIIGKFVYWLILLVFIISATEILGWEIVSKEISKLIEFLPKLLFALIFFIVGFYLSEMIKKAVYTATNSAGISGAKAISNIVFYVLMIFISITSLDQAGVDTTLFTSNITLIIGGALLAFAIAYGFASRDILTNILASFYVKDKYKVGLKIKVNGTKGVIENSDTLSITILTEDKRKLIIPIKKLISEEVEILT